MEYEREIFLGKFHFILYYWHCCRLIRPRCVCDEYPNAGDLIRGKMFHLNISVQLPIHIGIHLLKPLCIQYCWKIIIQLCQYSALFISIYFIQFRFAAARVATSSFIQFIALSWNCKWRRRRRVVLIHNVIWIFLCSCCLMMGQNVYLPKVQIKLVFTRIPICNNNYKELPVNTNTYNFSIKSSYVEVMCILNLFIRFCNFINWLKFPLKFCKFTKSL